MSGMIGILAQQTARYTSFWACFTQLLQKTPPNTSFDIVSMTDIPTARNRLWQRAMELGAEWILYLDDDQVFQPDLLLRLLSHDEPVVSGLYLQRAGRHEPIAYSHRDEEMTYHRLDLAEYPGEGLLKVKAVGAGALLVRAEVFDAIDPDAPTWFQHGRVDGEDWNAAEDIIFCEKAQRAGFDVFVDLEARVGHMAPSAIWPQFIDNQWCLGFSVADGTQLYVPIEPKPEEPARYEEVAE